MIPILLGAIIIVFVVRKNSDGIKNRCIKMALAAIFFSYPFVSGLRRSRGCLTPLRGHD
jgi:hypothetical protein